MLAIRVAGFMRVTKFFAAVRDSVLGAGSWDGPIYSILVYTPSYAHERRWCGADATWVMLNYNAEP